MAYGRRYSGYKRKGGYRSGYSRKRTAMRGAGRYAGNLTLTNRYTARNKVSLRDVELKYFDSTHDAAANAVGPDSGGAPVAKVGQLCIMAAGPNPDERIGRKIVVKEIAGNVELVMNAHQSDTIRICVVQDRQCNGAETTTNAIFTGTKIDDFQSIPNSNRFNILAMKVKTMNWTSQAVTADPALAGSYSNGETKAFLTFKIPCNIEVNYSDAAAAIASVKSNNIFIVVGSRDGKTRLASRWRIRYSDI